MFGKSAFLAFAFVASLTAPMKSLAQGPGDVSGIPHGPGSIGGVNNSVYNPSGIGNGARIPPPASPSISVPVVPSTAPMVSSPRSTQIVTRVNRRAAILSRLWVHLASDRQTNYFVDERERASSFGMIVTIHRGAPPDRSSLTDRTKPKSFDPLKVSAFGCPLYWARRQRCASMESLVSTVCTGHLG